MLKFYFHVRQGDAFFEDKEGTYCVDAEQAVARGRAYAMAVMYEEPDVPRSIQCIEVSDHHDHLVAMIPFELVPRPA